MPTIPVFVTRGGGRPVPVGLHIARDAYVFDLIDAVIVKLKLDVAADMVTLRLAGEPGAVLHAFSRLAAAGVHEESHLVIEVIGAPPVGACIKGELPLGLHSEQGAIGRGNRGCLKKRLGH